MSVNSTECVSPGGERVTLGSDAHRPDHIAANFAEALEALKTAGVKYVTVFERREAKMVAI